MQNKLRPFFLVCRAGSPAGVANQEKGEAGCRVGVTHGGSLGGLALGYCHAAPSGEWRLVKAYISVPQRLSHQ
jgi:hypothetical protein